MNSPVAAIGWQLYARCRWYLLAVGVYLVVALPLIYLLPEDVFACRLVRLYVAFPLAASPLGLFALFMFGADTDFESRESTYPSRMFVLPISSRALAGWPMFFGVSVTFLYCLALTPLALRPAGILVPLGWPAVLVAVMLAWTQALGWSACPLPWLRLIGIALLSVFQGLVVAMALIWGCPSPLVALLLSIQLPLCWYLASRAVRLARCGKSVGDGWGPFPDKTRSSHSFEGRRPFRDRTQAQLWMEWRVHGWCYPALVSMGLVFLVVLVLVKRQDTSYDADGWLRSPLIMFALPVFIALNIGAMFGRFVSSMKDKEPSSFLSTKPVSNVDFVAIKMRSSFSSILSAYVLTGLIVIVLLTITQSWCEGIPPIAGVDLHVQSPLLTWLAVPLLVFVTWKLGAQFLFVGLSGRPWVGVLFAMLTMLGLFGAVIGSFGLYAYPTTLEAVMELLPIAIWGIVACKFALAAWLTRKLTHGRLHFGSYAFCCLGFWSVAVLFLTGVFIATLPHTIVPFHVLVAGVILTVPLTRPLAAPLALAWNRHR